MPSTNPRSMKSRKFPAAGGGWTTEAKEDGRATLRSNAVAKAVEGASTEPDFALREDAKRAVEQDDAKG